jgi:hypothetical protein
MKMDLQRSLAVCLVLLLACGIAQAEPLIHRLTIEPSDFPRASEALQEAIENQGLIPVARSRFGEMLARTGPVLGHPAPVYDQAEIAPFCSAMVSWGLVTENPDYIALCPLTIAIYTLAGQPGTVYLSYREPGSESAALRAASALLRDIATATVTAARIFRPAEKNENF